MAPSLSLRGVIAHPASKATAVVGLLGGLLNLPVLAALWGGLWTQIGTVFTVMIVIGVGVTVVGTVGYVGLNQYLGQYEVFYFATLAFLITQGVYEPLIALYQATLNPKLVSLFSASASDCCTITLGTSSFAPSRRVYTTTFLGSSASLSASASSWSNCSLSRVRRICEDVSAWIASRSLPGAAYF